jgi:hypothetical protein
LCSGVSPGILDTPNKNAHTEVKFMLLGLGIKYIITE